MPDFKVEIRAQLAELRLPPVREAEIVEELSQHLAELYEEAMTRHPITLAMKGERLAVTWNGEHTEMRRCP